MRPYPVIKDIFYQNDDPVNDDPVEDGYRPVIVYKETSAAAAPERIMYGAYAVEGGEIALISGPELPVMRYDSENGSADDPAPLFDYAQPQNCIIGVFKISEYDADPSTAENYYSGGATLDGITITGIVGLPDNEEVIIVVRALRVSYRDALNYGSLRIEGYPQARSIKSVKVLNGNQVEDVPIRDLVSPFDYRNPGSLELPPGIIPANLDQDALPSVVVSYLDDTGMLRTIKVETSSDTISLSGISPHIKELVGIWRTDEYDENNPDVSKELLVSKGADYYKWTPGTTFINIHSEADLPTTENGEPVPIVIRFKDHLDQIHSVDHMPGRVRYVDNNPHTNIEITYQLRAVRSLDYDVPFQIKSEYSNNKSVTLLDLNPPVPPDA